MRLDLGPRRYDVRDRALVMGILNRTRDSFHEPGAQFALDALLRRAEQLVGDGADVLDVGGRAAGVGTEDVPADEEAERVAGAITALRARFDVPLSVDTWRPSVAAAAFEAGATVANDMSGFSDPEMLATAAAAGATVVATHIRRAPGVPDPDPRYDDVVAAVRDALRALVDRALGSGIPHERIVVDPGLDLGKTWRQSLRLLAGLEDVARLGRPVLLAASNKIFLGRVLGLGQGERAEATIAACTIGALRGARILRVHDARGARQAADLVAATLGAQDGGSTQVSFVPPPWLELTTSSPAASGKRLSPDGTTSASRPS
jgi:dihydropteroate synthase